MTRDIEDRLNMFVSHHRLRDYLKIHGQKPTEMHDEWVDRCCAGYAGELGNQVIIHRIALNMNQVEEYGPPPNPAKLTDSRGAGYVREYGDESWELDALEPSVITTLIEEQVFELRDDDQWEEALEAERKHKAQLAACSNDWPRIAKRLEGK